MSRMKCIIGWRWECRVRFGVFLYVAIFGLAAQLAAQGGGEARYGALEVTSGLGRKLYALPDDESVIDARKNLAADAKSVERVLQLSKAEAARRQYREAVATSTQGYRLLRRAQIFILNGAIESSDYGSSSSL